MHIDGENQVNSSLVLKNTLRVRWNMGNCSSSNSYLESTGYNFPAVYTERCCLTPGRHTLSCYNDPPVQGWKDAYITIDGHRYCDDFATFKSFQKVDVTGTYIMATIVFLSSLNIILLCIYVLDI